MVPLEVGTQFPIESSSVVGGFIVPSPADYLSEKRVERLLFVGRLSTMFGVCGWLVVEVGVENQNDVLYRRL